MNLSHGFSLNYALHIIFNNKTELRTVSGTPFHYAAARLNNSVE
jgi:hypothetical protein